MTGMSSKYHLSHDQLCDRIENTCISLKYMITEIKDFCMIARELDEAALKLRRKLDSKFLEITNKVYKLEEELNSIRNDYNKNDS